MSYLPHVNAALNLLAAVLLLLGLYWIKRGREAAHRRAMLACFGVSTIFLVCYLAYHASAGSRKFPTGDGAPPDWIRYGYYGMLLTHVVLAAAVPVLALLTIYHGLRDHRLKHRALARWTFPIWLYVSVTGVLVYLTMHVVYR